MEYQLTDRNGFVRFTAEAGDPGSYAYRFFYAGDEAASSAEHLSPLVVEKFTSFVDASGQLGTGKNRRTATVTGFLSNWHTNRVLTITATPDGGMPVVIAQGEVGEDHTLTVQYQIRSATTFTVSYAGDEWYTPGEDSIRLTLR